MINNGVLVSVVQQSDSVIHEYIYMYLFLFNFFFHLGCYIIQAFLLVEQRGSPLPSLSL